MNLFIRFFLRQAMLLLLFAAPLASQSLRAYEKAGNSAFEEKDFGAAASYYATVLKQKPDRTNVLWKYAESNLNLQAYSEAEKSYQRIVTDRDASDKFPLAMFRLGQIRKNTGDYDGAIAYFQKFSSNAEKENLELVEQANQEIAACLTAKALAIATSSKAQKVEITHLGKEINSPYSDFAPFMIGDTLFYSSYRFDKKNTRRQAREKQTKVMFSLHGGRGKEPGKGFPSADSAHIAHTAFSPDGRYMFFSVCQNTNAADIRCELWFTAIDRRNRWLPAVRLPEPINLPGYTQTQPAIGYDSTFAGPVLWFSSDRPGGKGNLDLWYMPLDTNFYCPCNLPLPGKQIGRLPEFEPPVNAASVNTAQNEITPFFDAAEQKLYFSSEGWPGLGGYDIFVSQKDAEQLSVPENAGYGLNTSYNDMYFFLKKDGRTGYLSSNRPGSFYLDEKNKSCCNDIFAFKLPAKEKKPETSIPEPDMIAQVPVLQSKTPELPEKMAVPDLPAPPKVEDFVGLPLYFDNDEPEKRTRKTETKKSYDETISDYLEQQNQYRDAFTTGLKGQKEEEAMNMVDAFFENEVRKGYERLSQLSDLIYLRLQQGERVEVVIKGFTSPRAKSDYNLNLGHRRVSSVKNHFASYNDGELLPFIRSGQLSLREASFGETTAKSGISDELSDLRNSVYHPDAARERRVEIVEIKIKE